MLYVVAKIELAEGKRDEFLAAQRALLPLVRAEQGCIEYTPTLEVPVAHPSTTPPRPRCVFMHEKWESLGHLQAHLNAEHMKDFRDKVRPLIASVQVEAFQPT